MRRHFVFLMLAAALCLFGVAYAQAPAAGLDGRWEGALEVPGAKLRLILDISKAADGLYLGTLTSVDQGGIKIPMDRIQLTGDSVHLEVRAVNGTFEGAMNAGKTQLRGSWSQGGPSLPLELTRTAAAAATAPPRAADATPPPAAATSPFGVPLELRVPVPPMPFPSGGKTYLVYELHITNFAGVEALMTKLEVLNGNTPLATFEGGELNSLLQRPGTLNLTDNRAIGPGMRAIAYLWISLDAGTPVPASLRHRVSGRNQSLEGGAVSVSTGRPVVLGPPLRGSDWIAANGPGNASAHRRALLPLGGHTAIAQRFAIDWLKVGPNGRSFDGNANENKTHFAYGNDVLAVADAAVVSTKDGIPENVPGPTSRAVPITPETIGGNYVILDLGDGRFAFYAHMQPGSLRVKLGDRVKRGQVIGLVGNTGNSTEPHLHFHVTDGNTLLESEGLPYVIESWEAATAPGMWEKRENQLPLQNARVRFPEK